MVSKIDEYKTLHDKVKACKKELDMLEKQERITANFLKSGISFIPAELNRLLATYMTLKEGELYIPISDCTARYKDLYCGIISSKKLQEEKTLSQSKGMTPYVAGIYEDEGIITFKCKRNTNINLVENLDEHLATYQFLIDKYDLNNIYSQYERGMVTKINFDEYEDIKNFIIYLAELQIENNKHYTYDEMLEILSNYLEQKKPKTRKLV